MNDQQPTPVDPSLEITVKGPLVFWEGIRQIISSTPLMHNVSDPILKHLAAQVAPQVVAAQRPLTGGAVNVPDAPDLKTAVKQAAAKRAATKGPRRR